MASVASLIKAYARRYGVDPQAAIAVALGEGGLRWGAVGDRGTSYGPFQLHRGGALPRGKNAAWANSPAGLEYAIRSMSQAGARGLTGRAAVEAIIRKFERPADPGSSIRNALARYGSTSAPAAGAAPDIGGGMPTASPAPDSSSARHAFAQALLDPRARRDPMQLVSLASSLRQAQTPSPTPQSSPTRSGGGAPSGGAGDTELEELIYGPMGALYDGKPGAPAPGHGGHIHVGQDNPQSMLAIIAEARRRGLSVRENPYTDRVDPVHTKHSHHYRTFPGRYNGRRLGQGADISGGDLKSFYRWLAARYG